MSRRRDIGLTIMLTSRKSGSSRILLRHEQAVAQRIRIQAMSYRVPAVAPT